MKLLAAALCLIVAAGAREIKPRFGNPKDKSPRISRPASKPPKFSSKNLRKPSRKEQRRWQGKGDPLDSLRQRQQ
ncbi:MAG: hypothetical protein K2X35_17935 [Bryobacteraceae bacterium]|nr:hypothetical protein [Bryobacteraceae bacterium]